MPEDPLRSHYFPEERKFCPLRDVLACVAGVPYVDGLQALDNPPEFNGI
jgi:hypothetical protein